MTERKSLGFEFHLGKTTPTSVRPAEPESPFRILVLGDFSGRASRGVIEPLVGRRPVPVNSGELEATMRRFGAQVNFLLGVVGGVQVAVRPATLDDFHPDQLFKKLDVFARVRDLRGRLASAGGFVDAARELQLLVGATKPADNAPPPQASALPSPATAAETTDQTLDRLLGRPAGTREPAVATDIGALVKEIVGPYIIREPHPDQEGMLQALDAVIARLMRAVLHHPVFQELEATWRGLDFLARNLELGEQLQIFVWDVSRDELTADMAGEDGSLSRLYQVLARDTVQTPGGQPWAVVTGCYTFGPTQEDAELLTRMAKVCHAAGAPFVAGADYQSFVRPDEAADEDGEVWQAVRRLPEASAIGLAVPRFLLRLPYGERTERIDTFRFEEQSVPPESTRYLWGNPAFACAMLLGQSFQQSGWAIYPGELLEIEGVPLHVYREGGESRATPPGEIWLTDRDAANLRDKGLMPLLSIRDRDAVRLMCFGSIGDARAPLSGRWHVPG